MFIFKDCLLSNLAYFDDADCLTLFLEKYKKWYISHFHTIPIRDLEYTITHVSLNPDFEDWLDRGC